MKKILLTLIAISFIS